ncbi:MAG: hypothetical protein WBW85_14410 [Terriglobales bacterium]
MADNCGKDWRELCVAAAGESDSEKLLSLVNQILQVLDERDPKPVSSQEPNRGSPDDVSANTIVLTPPDANQQKQYDHK